MSTPSLDRRLYPSYVCLKHQLFHPWRVCGKEVSWLWFLRQCFKCFWYRNLASGCTEIHNDRWLADWWQLWNSSLKRKPHCRFVLAWTRFSLASPLLLLDLTVFSGHLSFAVSMGFSSMAGNRINIWKNDQDAEMLSLTSNICKVKSYYTCGMEGKKKFLFCVWIITGSPNCGTFKYDSPMSALQEGQEDVNTYTLIQLRNGVAYMCLCATSLKKTPGSYIKLSPRHKPGLAVTLGGSVPNDIHHVGSNEAVVSTDDRHFWSICWAGGADGSRAQSSDQRWTPVNATVSIHLLSVSETVPPSFISLYVAQRWSGSFSNFFNFEPQTWIPVQAINSVNLIIYPCS